MSILTCRQCCVPVAFLVSCLCCGRRQAVGAECLAHSCLWEVILRLFIIISISHLLGLILTHRRAERYSSRLQNGTISYSPKPSDASGERNFYGLRKRARETAAPGKQAAERGRRQNHTRRGVQAPLRPFQPSIRAESSQTPDYHHRRWILGVTDCAQIPTSLP